MTTMDNIYEMPNIGCMLGMAYQAELSRLGEALSAAGLDITGAEYVIMRILFANGRTQQCEISRIVGKDKASVSRSVQSLVRKGFATVTQVSYKCSMVALSEKGEELRPLLLEIAEAQQRALSLRISQKNLEELREILKQIIN